MDNATIADLVDTTSFLNRMGELAEKYGAEFEQGWLVEATHKVNRRTGAPRGFFYEVFYHDDLVMVSDTVVSDPYSFASRRALRKTVKRALKLMKG